MNEEEKRSIEYYQLKMQDLNEKNERMYILFYIRFKTNSSIESIGD